MMIQKQAKIEEKEAFMAETKHKWLKTDKLDRKIGKIWMKTGMLAMLCFCTFQFFNSFLPNCQFLFCQATQFCSARAPPAPKNAYECSAVHS